MSGYGGPGIIGNNQYLAAEPYTLHEMVAGEDIGQIDYSVSGGEFPENPWRAFGIPISINNPAGAAHVQMEIPALISLDTRASAINYVGVSNNAVQDGGVLSVRNRGDAWFIAGQDAIVAGQLAILDIDATNVARTAEAGDIMPFGAASGATTGGWSAGSAGDLTDITGRLSGMVGRALTSSAARTGTGVGQYDIVKVRMRGV